MEQIIEFFLYLIILILAVPTSIIMGIASIISELAPLFAEYLALVVNFFAGL